MGESCPKLLDLISKKREWVVSNGKEGEDESKKLELRLGLPGNHVWFVQKSTKNNSTLRNKEESKLLSLSNFSYSKEEGQEQKNFVQYQTGPRELAVMNKESSSQPCCTTMAGLQAAEKKAFSPVSAHTAVPNTSQKRAAPAVVGWPPVRSFRKNLASTGSAKPVSEPQTTIASKPVNEKQGAENLSKGLFVKINMDGIPIGRKIDLNAYDSYQKLSSAVDELFRGFLAAQTDRCDCLNENEEGQKDMKGLMEGSGEYALVYEDNEGDRLLVADVPWSMFVSTVKRLRVLKSSDPHLPTLARCDSKKVNVSTVQTSTK